MGQDRARHQHAFTLVELLVIIGIVALLIGMLMPALGMARQQSQSVACLSNLRQIGIGVLQYANAHRGLLPQNAHHGAAASWIESLQSFGVPPAVRRCPADDREPAPTTSYATNNFTVAPRPYTKLNRIRRPAATIYAAEVTHEGDHLHATAYLTAADIEADIAVKRHRGGSNFLFCDGHAERLPFAHFQNRFTPHTSPFDPATAQ